MKLLTWLPLLITSACAATTGSSNSTSSAGVKEPVQNCPTSGVCYTLQDYGSEVQFTFQFPSTLGWAALGTGSQMKGSTIMVAWRNPDNTFTVSDRVATGTSEPAAAPTQASKIVTSESKVENGNNIVKFRRAKNTGQTTLANFDDAQINWIWATSTRVPSSNLASSRINYHNSFGKFQLDAAKGTTTAAPASSPISFFLIHGILMFSGWNLMPYFGILAAGPFKKILGVWWFRIHVALLGFAGPALVAAGFVLVVISKSSTFRSPHSILGLITVILQALQIILGIVIDRLWNPERVAIPCVLLAFEVASFLHSSQKVTAQLLNT
ncbi:CBD9-like protein [Conidiobolus coronatus NRRL 28638]|uniref:CBD9-like protein n=1 Tax=Conidiobolus coronatus (strain ATCC 28846 / CBS 209.66 / NRRL 28638) TaxID=796925 RepID=A0A137P067_CONC2|nr:CBD9-like protein [Conidiobolus coronatus NRRL 28638]|eukprot:KXN68382.1 CBD9-like protein [Conidiobolus coronatus NRRL 28638]